MADSTNPFSIPTTFPMVAGYVNGVYAWSPAGWARFAKMVRWEISVTAFQNVGNVLDVERFDAIPTQAPSWAKERRAAGVDPIIYVQQSNWGQVQAAFHQQGGAAPHYWIANYDGDPTIPAGAIAKQYANQPLIPGQPHYDLSNVAGTFGADSAQLGDTMTDAQFETLVQMFHGIFYATSPAGDVWAAAAIKQKEDLVKEIVAAIPAASGGGLNAAQEQLLTDISATLARIETALKGA
jgi:hypothetical protein